MVVEAAIGSRASSPCDAGLSWAKLVPFLCSLFGVVEKKKVDQQASAGTQYVGGTGRGSQVLH